MRFWLWKNHCIVTVGIGSFSWFRSKSGKIENSLFFGQKHMITHGFFRVIGITTGQSPHHSQMVRNNFLRGCISQVQRHPHLKTKANQILNCQNPGEHSIAA